MANIINSDHTFNLIYTALNIRDNIAVLVTNYTAKRLLNMEYDVKEATELEWNSLIEDFAEIDWSSVINIDTNIDKITYILIDKVENNIVKNLKRKGKGVCKYYISTLGGGWRVESDSLILIMA